MRRMAQHYQAQLAAAEGEIQAAKTEQAAAAQSEVDALREQLLEVKGVLQQRAEAELAAARAAGEAAAAQLRQQLGAARAAAQEAAAAAERRAGEAAALQAEREAELEALAAQQEAEREALAAQQEAAAAAQRRFELLKKNYEVGSLAGWGSSCGGGGLPNVGQLQTCSATIRGQQAAGRLRSPTPDPLSLLPSLPQALMRQYAPGVGAGVFLERAVSRKAAGGWLPLQPTAALLPHPDCCSTSFCAWELAGLCQPRPLE
jgi:hypothetical protein